MIPTCGWAIDIKEIKKDDQKIVSGWSDPKANDKELEKAVPWTK